MRGEGWWSNQLARAVIWVAVSKRGGSGSAGAPRLLQQLLPVKLGLF
jgi:hypothetical protein